MADVATILQEPLTPYFVVQNPTPGTGFAENITTSFTATSAFMTVFNSASAGGKSIFPDYLRIICSAVGATTTSGHGVFVLDSINRYSSGTLSTPTPASSNSSAISVATIQVGTITAAAASAPKLVGRSVLRIATAPAWAAFDEVIFHFGSPAATQPQAVTPTTAVKLDVFLPPVAVPPGSTLLYQPYNVANATTAPSFEYEFGWWER